MEFKHRVWKWIPPNTPEQNGFFKEVWSKSTQYFSIGAYQDCDEDLDEMETDTLSELWLLWQEQKDRDESVGEKGCWRYHFYYHNEVVEDGHLVDYVTPIKIYRRGNKVFWKAIQD